ncbi:MAG: DUF4249 domain-containing protein [Bacteroidales bacterium]|nr:DUF4249 domain-containing protein [Bacteroidales bacterium]
MLKRIILFLLSVWVILSGCEETMDIEFDEIGEPKLVVEGSISTDTAAHIVKLSWTSDFFSVEGPEMVTGANVSISDNGGSIYVLSESEPGIYQTNPDVYGVIGRTYTLHVTLTDGRTFEATDEINEVPVIDSLKQSNNYNHFDPSMDMFGWGYDIIYYGPEPEGVGDYYMWNLYINDTLMNDTIIESIFTDDVFVDGNYIFDFELFFVNENDIHGNTAKITVETKAISKGYYNFLIGLMLETVWRGSPWDGPPANIPSNVKPEGYGYFHAYSNYKKSIYIKQTDRGKKAIL